MLHAPGQCQWCDKHPEWQHLREMWSINFTGQYDDGKVLCPSEYNRLYDTINEWSGNRPDAGEASLP